MQSQAAMRAARVLLDNGTMADPWARQNGEVRTAVPVECPKGLMHAWFVPVTHADLLIGFFELTPELVARRYSTFQQSEGSLEGCPHIADWVDHATIRRRVEERIGDRSVTGEPYLSYDTHPSQFAWAVPIDAGTGDSRLMFVAGNLVFESAAGR